VNYTSIVRLRLSCGILAIVGASALIAQTQTPNGQPELQGVWLSNSATPLERPAAVQGRALLTDAEVAELQKRATRLLRDGSNDFAAGDNVFLAAINNVEHYSSPATTDRNWAMIAREFDNRTSLITDPSDGKLPPLTAEAQRWRAAAVRRPPRGPEDLNNAERCLTFGVPRIGGNFGAGPYSYYQIVQTPEYVVFYMEAIHETRIIPLDGRAHLPQSIRSWTGDSVGRWEGKTLVVDTTNLPARNGFMGSGPRLHLIERFTRVSENRLNYEATLEDPDTWTKPWTAMLPLKRSEDKMFEFACHEGNATVMKGMLEGGQ
jgi:hypothetical protein